MMKARCLFFYSSSKKFPGKLTFKLLKDKPEAFHQAATWAEQEWGYLRVSKGQPLGVQLAGRKQLLLDKQNSFYLAYYDKSLIGMFGCKSIILDTLKPGLNRFYEKNGAVFSGEGYVLDALVDFLNIRCNVK